MARLLIEISTGLTLEHSIISLYTDIYVGIQDTVYNQESQIIILGVFKYYISRFSYTLECSHIRLFIKTSECQGNQSSQICSCITLINQLLYYAKLSPCQPANLQLSWAKIALLSKMWGTYSLHPTPTLHPPTHLE